MPYPAKIDPSELGRQCLALIEDKGWDAWTIRDVAIHLGVSPNAIYRYVDGRDGLIVHIGAAAANAVREAIEVAVGDDPTGRFVDMAYRYVDFAITRPAAYQAFVRAKPDATDPAYGSWYSCWVVVQNVASEVAPDCVDSCGFALWSMLHGRIDLTLGPTALINARTGLEDAVRAVIAGFASAGALDPLIPTFDGG